jgi:TonB family protein
VCFTTVVRSSGNAKLDRAVLDSINRWRLVPARQGNTDVESLHLIMLTQKMTR